MVLREFIHNFDFFRAVAGFRVRGEPEVLSICGGIVSLLLLGFFLYVFLEDAIKIISYEKIQSKEVTKISEQGSQKIEGFFFAIGIEGHTIENFSSYLSIQASNAHVKNNNFNYTDIELVQCQKEMWDEVTNIDKLFEVYDIDQMLCPKEQTNLVLNGLRSDNQSQYLYITVNLCSENQTACSNVSSINSYIKSYIAENRYFAVNFFMISTGFNLGEQDPSFVYLDQDTWITFNDQFGQEVHIKIGSYTMKSDISMLPWQESVQELGYYIASVDDTIIQPHKLNQFYLVDIIIEMSRESKHIQRSFGKLDQSLGNVGGLFAIVFGFLSFFFMSYNEYRYELMVSEGTFSYDHGQKYKQEDFNVFTYIKYSLYDWIRFLGCCCEPQWENCKKIAQSRDQANQQLDIKYFMKRLAYLEKVAKLKVSEEQQVMEHLSEPVSIESVKKKRKIMEYYDIIMKDKMHLTIAGLRTAKKILQLATHSQQKFENTINLTEEVQNFSFRQQTLQQIFRKHQTYLQVEDSKISLSQEEMELQKYIAEVFFRIESENLEKMKDRIPLLILYRLHKISNRQLGQAIKEIHREKKIKSAKKN